MPRWLRLPSPPRATRIQRAQNAESHAIYNQRHDAQTGNPNSLSSRRMQGAVRRDLDQQSRIASGVDHGGLTHREVSHLSAQQARSLPRGAMVSSTGASSGASSAVTTCAVGTSIAPAQRRASPRRLSTRCALQATAFARSI